MVFFRRAASSAHIDKDVAGVKMFHAFCCKQSIFVSMNFHPESGSRAASLANDGIQEEVLAL